MDLQEAEHLCAVWTESNVRMHQDKPGAYKFNWGSNEILIGDIAGWAICKYSDDNGAIYYGEHYNCGLGLEFKGSPGWGWEWSDAEAPRNKEGDRCWGCGNPVPEGIIGMVAMINWKELEK